ncbi:hypothetical protein NQ647_03450 [Acinetobacter baumannii]|nr:hypothetical protein [Acinetobacter baumannii]MDC4534635.1 hypothetical protein [Acinetobacter baumannii]
MKKILFCLLIGCTSTAIADDGSQKLKFCESISKYAEIIMHNRQHGEQAIAPINRIEKSLKDHQIKGFYIAIIKDAYKQPLWNTEEKKKEAETEFANEALMICLDRFKD